LGSRIEIDVREGEKKLVVCVKDYGIGIEGDVLDKLFYESHKHVHLGTNNEKGTGVGLMLVKEFVRKNGGEIWAESEKGKGSSFYFSVPKA
jgi:signal transduction histidine kinase